VDGGEFPVKRTLGEKLAVCAHIFADGHDKLGAVLRWRPLSDAQWSEVPMSPGYNDLWSAEFEIGRLERYEYTIEAWVDAFASWRDGLSKKWAAGVDVGIELLEGAQLVVEAAQRARGDDRARLEHAATSLGADVPEAVRVERALADELATLMRRWADRTRASQLERPLEVDVNRERARYGAWYELFPRSAGSEPGRHATLREAEARLEEVAAMGFDVLYLPPVHPIGRTHRKGRNNRLAAAASDPGSPWAIGSAEGGHTSLHPELGTLDDFDHFLSAARDRGLELALDLAFQCSPDHPWVKQHPDWFRSRADGSIQYAENPPKKYQDIYPLNFDCADWRGLWQELLAVTLFWCERGVRIFRVDNPHTKPLRLWGWLIAEVKSRHPETIFLSEAFTRPNVMFTLAKLGFDQSYTYFTWRNAKAELTDYLTELTRTEVAEFLRPNFFANTPDILPEYLQYGGRAAFQVRLVLAATLAANYGIYSGFELCEARAVPGTEEYQDSEKYQLKHRDWNARGHIRALVRKLNVIRRDNPALWSDRRLRFHPVENDQLICYSKSTADLSNVILVVVNLDPHHVHDGWLELPLEELGIGAGESFQAHDLLGEGRYLWHGSRNYVRLDAAAMPAQVFGLRRRVRTERDFDYFM
jgi:starch synthase (maltosyl-transferring)